MNFLVDAHLPRRLTHWLRLRSHDVVYTCDLPQGNHTGDSAINTRPVLEQRIFITKDADFVDSFVLRKQPYKPLLVSTGNISNDDLIALFTQSIADIEQTLETNEYIEISRTSSAAEVVQ
jgi:predicted nuclease of predicted toxin-antitoxin system